MVCRRLVSILAAWVLSVVGALPTGASQGDDRGVVVVYNGSVRGRLGPLTGGVQARTVRLVDEAGVSKLVDVIRRHVRDREVLAAIVRDLERVTALESAREAA